jgi:hypothetical protein
MRRLGEDLDARAESLRIPFCLARAWTWERVRLWLRLVAILGSHAWLWWWTAVDIKIEFAARAVVVSGVLLTLLLRSHHRSRQWVVRWIHVLLHLSSFQIYIPLWLWLWLRLWLRL